MSTINDLLKYANEDNPSAFEDTFKGMMADKLGAAIEARATEVSSNMYADDEETGEGADEEV